MPEQVYTLVTLELSEPLTPSELRAAFEGRCTMVTRWRRRPDGEAPVVLAEKTFQIRVMAGSKQIHRESDPDVIRE